jgi:hypothetical protein
MSKLNDLDYEQMSEEQYYKEMEQKVEYYKLHYPDMYEKAQQWISMLDHSEVYKTHSGTSVTDSESGATATVVSSSSMPPPPAQNEGNMEQALDILKNMNYLGLLEEDITEKERDILSKSIPDWTSKLLAKQ